MIAKVPDRRGGSLMGRHVRGHELCTRPEPRPRAECEADTPKWIRDESDKRVHEAGTHWVDVLQGGYAVWWIERYMRLYEGRWAGEPAVMHGCKTCKQTWLIPNEFDAEHAMARAEHHAECVAAGHDIDWQYDFLMRLFSWVWYDPEKSRTIRRFRKGDLWIPKKNKKSPSLAFLGWYLAVGDGVNGQKVYFGAKDGAQAKEMVGGHAVAAWEESPFLQSSVRYTINEMKFHHVPTKSEMKPLSSSNARTTKSKEGLNGSILIDEVHVVDAEFMKRIKRAGISRLEPIQLGVSTAGLSTVGYGKARQDFGRKVASGEALVDDYLFCCFEADQSIDIESVTEEKVLELGKAANPAWGNTITQSEFLSDYRDSLNGSIDELHDFATYRLNIWQNSTSPWIRGGSWAKCGRDFTFDELRGRRCVLGLDLSRTRDMTAAVLVFERDDRQRRQIWPLFWLPANTAKRHRAKVPQFADWEREGHLSLTPADTISQSQVFEELGHYLKDVVCTHVFYDPTFADWLTEQIEGQYEAERVVFPQSMAEYAEPTAMLEEEILNGTIEHPNHPILDWQFSHVHVHRNRFTKQKRPVKPDQEDKDPRTIDGVVALVMGERIDLVEEQQTLDYYEHNELEIV